MAKNWYREALEAIGMKGRDNTIHNRLNAVAIHSDDPELRALVEKVLSDLRYCGLKTQLTSIRDSRLIDTKPLVRLCEKKGYTQEAAP